MKFITINRAALGICATAALLSACGGSQPPIGATPQSSATTLARIVTHRRPASNSYKVVYQFKGRPDGREPRAEVLDVNGTFYGTTYNGGESACFRKLGCGTVYTVTASGSETVLHSFTGGSDGAHPAAGLIDVNGTLYGATEYGGDAGCKKAGCGTVYSITTSGSEKVLHSFSGSPDGARPAAPLINVDGTLYGTTKDGGTSECTVITGHLAVE